MSDTVPSHHPRCPCHGLSIREAYDADLSCCCGAISLAVADLNAEVERLTEALYFYADPDTYFAIAFWFDPPCGDFQDDFSEDHGNSFYNRAMPGKLARAVLRGEKVVSDD